MTRTDHESFQPTPVDRLFPQLYIRTQLTFHRDDVTECANHLRKGMERLIQMLPFLAREMFTHVNCDGPDTITTKPLSLQDLDKILKIRQHQKPLQQAVADCGHDRARLDETFMPLPICHIDVSQPCPVMAVQANIHPDGLLLSVATNHVVMDATGHDIAIRSLADCCRMEGGETVTWSTFLAEQDRGREMLMHELPAKMVGQEPEYKPCESFHLALVEMEKAAAATVRGANFVIAAEDVDALKTRCNEMLPQILEENSPALPTDVFPGGVPWVSSSDVVTALIWLSVNRVRDPMLAKACNPSPTTHSEREGVPDEVTLELAVNIRKRVSPALPMSYMGNGVLPLLIPIALQAFAGADWISALSRVALAIRMRLAAMDSDEIRSRLYYVQNEPHSLPVTSDTTSGFVSNWREMGIYSADFGSKMGNPQYVRTLDSMMDGAIFIMPKRPQQNAPWEFHLSLKHETLQRLQQDDAWAAYVRPDSYWP